MLARIALVLGLLLVWLIVLMPLKAVALAAGGSQALGYRDVFGTIWQGRVYGLTLNGVPVRELEVSLDPLALVSGQLGGNWRLADASLRGDGVARFSPASLELGESQLVVTLDRLGLEPLPGLDPAERVFVRLSRLEIRDGACVAVSGTARTGALIGLARLYGRDGPAVTGEFACVDDRLVLDWTGAVDGLSLDGRVSFRSDGYDWTARIETSWPELVDGLALAGMQRDGTAWRAEGSERYGPTG
ncbi:hypothetical protein AWH62_13445 [Maricaulis sp. W15]|uniref:type II secretion system protein N n=1 Tax=Maricaulis sp. W15 TaxID=1772333 RepID=UPI000949114D|nr:type II secretion system protein N [Maricaulis sp. W15]OLF71058.1 hypothetical protein AWH62_13445 [Maricaulis sp. W15]